jgi:hypothetical protein
MNFREGLRRISIVRFFYAGVVCGLVILTGCTEPQPVIREANKSPYQRFVPIHREPANLPETSMFSSKAGIPWSGAFALDTKTGQLCWTYHEGLENKGDNSWPHIPDCYDLYRADKEP